MDRMVKRVGSDGIKKKHSYNTKKKISKTLKEKKAANKVKK